MTRRAITTTLTRPLSVDRCQYHDDNDDDDDASADYDDDDEDDDDVKC